MPSISSDKISEKNICKKKTFFYDNIRCFLTGIIEAGLKTFVLLIAIRVFEAPNICKALLSSIGFTGLLIAPIMVSYTTKFQHTPATNVCGYYSIIVSIAFLLSAIVQSFWQYFMLIAIARILFKQYIPLMLDVYGNNYSDKERGYKLSYALMLLPISTIMFSPLGGYILDTDLKNYKIVLLIVALASIGVAYAFFKIPSRPIPISNNNSSVLSNFKLIIEDKFFLKMLIIMVFVGIATQMTNPLRAEYLANAKYGINVSNFLISLILTTIPYGCRIASSTLWGTLFDKLSLIKMRIIVNIFIMIGLLMFFNSTSISMLILSSIFLGIGYSGGEIIWCLWITKITDKDKLSNYMSATTAVVGSRSFISPFIGYFLIDLGVPFSMIGVIAAVLISLSILCCYFVKDHPRFSGVYS